MGLHLPIKVSQRVLVVTLQKPWLEPITSANLCYVYNDDVIYNDSAGGIIARLCRALVSVSDCLSARSPSVSDNRWYVYCTKKRQHTLGPTGPKLVSLHWQIAPSDDDNVGNKRERISTLQRIYNSYRPICRFQALKS